MLNRTLRRAATLAFFACAAPSNAGAQFPLQSAAEQIVRKVGGDWGVMAWSIDRKTPLFAVRANEVFIPASNNKVFTAVWALDMLGPDYRFPTDLLIQGPVRDGVLRGNVIIRGSGDPAFGYPEYEKEPMRPLLAMAERLRSMGIRSVQGYVIGDATAFDTAVIGLNWPRDTGGGSAYYAPGVSGLPFQRNLVWIEARPGAGGRPQITLDPPVDIPLVSSVRNGGGRAWAVRKADEDTIRVKGAVSGRLARFGVGVQDPAMLTAGALRAALLASGIQVQGGARVGATPKEAKLVHRHLSLPLGQMVAKLNQDSDNFFAEHFWKAASHKAIGEGSYSRGGAASALHFIRKARVPAGQLYQFDGSGLSSLNRASPNAMVRTLIYAHEQPWSKVFHESLAVGGRRPGTLYRLFRGTAAEGNLHAKTGYIDDVRTLSGYVRAANGELVAFSFLYNGKSTSAARAVQTELGTLLANYGGGGEQVAERPARR